jgi:polyhydroxybutyrate depolymerase
MRITAPAVIGAACLLASVAAAEPCGGDTACTVEGGAYRIELPEKGAARGVYLFFHGYKSSAELQMRHRALVDVAHRHGLAFAAVDGLNGTWSHENAPGNYRNETAFVDRVLDDLETRFGFGPTETLVGGFSQGASMAWYTVCHSGGRVAGAVTFSGVYWNPLPKPEDCVANPPPRIHFHGSRDRTFPLTGRAIGTGYHQGDTFASMAIARQTAACEGEPQALRIDDLTCSVSTGCVRGEVVLCLHDGGHSVRPDLLDIGLTRLGF